MKLKHKSTKSISKWYTEFHFDQTWERRDTKYGILQRIMKRKWILRNCDFDLWPRVTNFNRVRVSAVSNHLAKAASKSVHPFGWNFVHKQTSDTHTDCNENIIPPRFRACTSHGVIYVNWFSKSNIGSLWKSILIRSSKISVPSWNDNIKRDMDLQ